MDFSEYRDIGQVQIEYNIRLDETDFVVANEVKPSETFLRELKFTTKNLPVLPIRLVLTLFGALHFVFQEISKKVRQLSISPSRP